MCPAWCVKALPRGISVLEWVTQGFIILVGFKLSQLLGKKNLVYEYMHGMSIRLQS